MQSFTLWSVVPNNLFSIKEVILENSTQYAPVKASVHAVVVVVEFCSFEGSFFIFIQV